SGYVKATTIMTLERILQDIEGPDRRFRRDPLEYHVCIFGKPSTTGTWGWSVEGHHLSVNFTIVDGKEISATPNFMGTNPAEVRNHHRQGLRVLAEEEDIARVLVKSLNADQRKEAIIDVKAPADIFSGEQRKISPLDWKGIRYS